MIATPSNPVSNEPQAPARPTDSRAQAGPTSPLDASMPWCLDASPPSALLPHPSSLLESLAQGADPAALAASHNISLVALALWLREPQVKDILDALHDLFALHRAAWRHQVIRDTVESLRDGLKTSDNLPERRRAAAHIIRALSSPLSRAPRERAGERATASTFPPSPAPNAPAPSASPNPVSPSVRHSVSRAADSTGDLIISALQQSTDPAVLDAVRAMRGGPHDGPHDGPAARAFDASLQHLIAALPGATVTSTPAEPEAPARGPSGTIHATKRYTLARAGAQPIHFLFRLGCDPARDDCWIEDIAPLDTS